MVLSALIGHYAKQNILLYLGRRDNYKPKPCITTWWHWTSQCCRVQCVSHHLKTLHVSLFNLVSCPKNNILKLIDKNLLIYGYALLICTFEILIGVIFKLWPKSNTEGDFSYAAQGDRQLRFDPLISALMTPNSAILPSESSDCKC